MLPPESAALEVVAREVGVGAGTLERWREDAQSRPARGRAWTAAGRLEAVVTTAAMNEAELSAWCRSHGVYPQDLAKWRASATTALAAPEELRASPQATRADRKRIKELEQALDREPPADRLALATRGETRDDGSVLVHVVDTTSPHRAIVVREPDGALRAGWHIPPLWRGWASGLVFTSTPKQVP